MAGPHPRDLGLAEARALVQRAVDKAEQLGLHGAVAVVGASGTLLTASRMDAGGPGGMARARSKAWISATQQIPSSEHLHRMTTIAPPVAAGFAQASPEASFPGAGGMPVSAGGVVVAGIAASGATVSPFFPADIDPHALSVDGWPANAGSSASETWTSTRPTAEAWPPLPRPRARPSWTGPGRCAIRRWTRPRAAGSRSRWPWWTAAVTRSSRT